MKKENAVKQTVQLIVALSLVAGVCVLVGCRNNDAQTTHPATEQTVAEFHAKFNKADFKGIYAVVHPSMKAAISEKDFVVRLEAVYQKLGTVQATELPDANFGVLVDMRPVKIDATYKTKFATGDAKETFTLLMDGKTAPLSDYKINPPPPQPRPGR